MRKNIVAGNWKMNKNLQEGIEFVKALEVASADRDKINCEVILGTPFIHLAHVSAAINDKRINVAAQNCADKASAA